MEDAALRGLRVADAPADDPGVSVLRSCAHVLVVDDDQKIRHLAALLERRGYTFALATNAEEARRLAPSLVDPLRRAHARGDGSGADRDVLRFHHDIAAVMVTGAEDPALAERRSTSGRTATS